MQPAFGLATLLLKLSEEAVTQWARGVEVDNVPGVLAWCLRLFGGYRRECPCLWKTHISFWGDGRNIMSVSYYKMAHQNKKLFYMGLATSVWIWDCFKMKINLKYLIHFPSKVVHTCFCFLRFCLEYLDSCLLIPLDGVSKVINALYAPESSSKGQAGPHHWHLAGWSHLPPFQSLLAFLPLCWLLLLRLLC